jgi:hypothetical protein
MNLLDFDMGGPSTGNSDLLDTGSSQQNKSGNLYDDMFDSKPQNVDVLGSFGASYQSEPVKSSPSYVITFKGVPGFTTAQFGQTWM